MMRIHDPLKQWKLSPMDVESRARLEQYTKAKDVMFEHTHAHTSLRRRGGSSKRSTRKGANSIAAHYAKCQPKPDLPVGPFLRLWDRLSDTGRLKTKAASRIDGTVCEKRETARSKLEQIRTGKIPDPTSSERDALMAQPKTACYVASVRDSDADTCEFS